MDKHKLAPSLVSDQTPYTQSKQQQQQLQQQN